MQQLRNASCAALVPLALALAGCGDERVVMPSSDRVVWASQLGAAVSESEDPALVRTIESAARESGARIVDVTVLALNDRRRIPVVTLEADDAASYLKHDLQEFLDRIGYFEPQSLAYVEVLDGDGDFAWSAGRFPNGGMVHPRPDLDACSPIAHSQLIGVEVPPCPAS